MKVSHRVIFIQASIIAGNLVCVIVNDSSIAWLNFFAVAYAFTNFQPQCREAADAALLKRVALGSNEIEWGGEEHIRLWSRFIAFGARS